MHVGRAGANPWRPPELTEALRSSRPDHRLSDMRLGASSWTYATQARESPLG